MGIVSVATPEPLSVPVPSVVAPSLNVTVPLGVPPLPVTVAAKVTACPNVLGFGDEVRVVEVGAPTPMVAVADAFVLAVQFAVSTRVVALSLVELRTYCQVNT